MATPPRQEEPEGQEKKGKEGVGGGERKDHKITKLLDLKPKPVVKRPCDGANNHVRDQEKEGVGFAKRKANTRAKPQQGVNWSHVIPPDVPAKAACFATGPTPPEQGKRKKARAGECGVDGKQDVKDVVHLHQRKPTVGNGRSYWQTNQPEEVKASVVADAHF